VNEEYVNTSFIVSCMLAAKVIFDIVLTDDNHISGVGYSQIEGSKGNAYKYGCSRYCQDELMECAHVHHMP
jgi:hypothetical protein